MGKVPPRILKETVFKSLGFKREDVIVGPSEGEDAAIIRIGKDLVAVHCDPISGAYHNIGWIAMNVATNDIATRGVKPSWALTCVMLPEGSRKKDLVTICRQMGKAAEKLKVSIIGGHSEVTMGLNHPLVVVTVFGLAQGGKYVTTGRAKPGSKIILTKSIGIEGTAILAFDMEKLLVERFGDEFVDRAKGFFDKISILKEALLAFDNGGVLAMHDPTEGGVAGGLNEMADASKTGFKVYEDRIPVKNETSKIFFDNSDVVDQRASLGRGARCRKTDRYCRLQKPNLWLLRQVDRASETK